MDDILTDLDKRIGSPSGGIDVVSDIDQRIRQANQPASTEQRVSPLGTNWENFWAATGKGMTGVVQGAKQISDVPAQWLENQFGNSAVAKFGANMGMPTAQQSAINTQANIDEAAARDRPLMETGAGKAGYALGTTAGVIGALAPAAAASVPGAMSLLAPSGYGSAMAAGALQGALQPTETGGDSRLWNTGLGAAAGAAGNLAVNTLGRVVSPARDALSAVYQKAVNVLDSAGVPLDAAQRTGSAFLNKLRSSFSDNPWTAGAQAEMSAQQKSAFNQAVLKTVGADSNTADQATMSSALNRINGTFRDILNRNKVDITDDVLSRVGAVQSAALDESQTGIAKLASRFIDSADQNGQVPGQTAYALKKDLDRLASSSDSNVAYHARQLRSTVMDAINDSLPAVDQTAFSQARGQFANLKKIEGVIQDGDISPAKLANVFNQRGNRGISVYGQGPQELFELAQAGKMLLTDKTPNSGTFSRALSSAGSIPGMAAAVVQKPAQMIMNNPTAAELIGNYPGVTYTPLRDLLLSPQTNPAVGAVARRLPIAGVETMKSPSTQE